MWTTPFSGPSQRSWLSPVRRREKAAVSARTSSRSEPDHQRRQRVDRRDLDLGTAAGGEREAVALEPVRRVGAQDRVGGGVVGIDVDGVGAVEQLRRRKADVGGLERGDGGSQRSPPSML